ncbi:MAG TPA: FAD-linked oxidase C-terminal domain-containing protein [Gemmataceae bacterium]|nr:FAD-linked oxidase C-terminal domain-containing protein [Gemmataceae bacterium]
MDLTAVRAKLVEDLRRQFRGALHADELTRALYATDASLFRVTPLAVAVPQDEGDLQTLVRYASERSLPLIPRGAGTGLAGESLGHGIVVDLSTHFRAISEIGSDWVRVQPGVVLRQLNVALAKTGRRFGPDPASAASCTIGGMIATDASGGRAVRHGSTRQHVRQLRVVWDDGTADALGGPTESVRPRTAAIRDGLDALRMANRELIQAQPPRPAFDRCGYRVHELLNEPDPLRLIPGSEGTLAFVTEATLRTIPVPGGRAAVVLGFASVEDALHAARLSRELWPAACEILDRRLISLARAQSPDAAALVPAETEAALLVEFERDSSSAARDAVRGLIDTVQHVHHLAVFAVPALDPRAADDMWAIRDAALPSLYAIGQGARPLAFVEDIGVPLDVLPEFIGRAKGVLKRFEVAGSMLIHAGTGQVHLRPFLDPENPEEAAKLWPLADELHGLAIDLGGTISAQHGTGIARTPWVEKQAGPLYAVYKELKRVFDPRGILNPGKIVGPDPSRPAWPLRPAVHRTSAVKPLLEWHPVELPRAVAACSGCGACRTEAPGKRMCPMFRLEHTEAAAPRAKANMVAHLLETDPGRLGAADVRAVANLCVNCKMCASECPAKADIPKLMLEAKAANHAANGLSRHTWFLARFDGLTALASQFSLSANFLLARPTVRWALEKMVGLARRRTLPAFSFLTFLGRARRRGLTKRPKDGPAVAYFVDTYANYFDPSVGEATIAVLKHNDIPVYVPSRQKGTGAAALAQGDTDVARQRLAYNVKHLADCVRAGDTIVCSEPTAALFFRQDAFALSPDPDVKLVADHTIELSSYLWSLHLQGKLKTDFRPLNLAVGHHVPCHVKAMGAGAAGPRLLELIPEFQVNKIDLSCSGMAGPWGLNAANYESSLMAGRPMLDELGRSENRYGSAECSSCRLQMQEGTGKRALHPVQYLALAYGLMPSLADRLKRPIRPRISS